MFKTIALTVIAVLALALAGLAGHSDTVAHGGHVCNPGRPALASPQGVSFIGQTGTPYDGITGIIEWRPAYLSPASANNQHIRMATVGFNYQVRFGIGTGTGGTPTVFIQKSNSNGSWYVNYYYPAESVTGKNLFQIYKDPATSNFLFYHGPAAGPWGLIATISFPEFGVGGANMVIASTEIANRADELIDDTIHSGIENIRENRTTGSTWYNLTLTAPGNYKFITDPAQFDVLAQPSEFNSAYNSLWSIEKAC